MWSYIVIEGICLGTRDGIDKLSPCGNRAPSPFCLKSGHCPHFAYTTSNEREAAFYVPLRLIIWDKLKDWLKQTGDDIRWQLWGRWHYDKDWVKKMPTAECPAWDNYLEKARQGFPQWLAGAKQDNCIISSSPSKERGD